MVAVSGPYVAAYAGATVQSLSGTTCLTSRKDRKKRIPLKDFISPAERQDGMAIFIFPRTIEGAPAFEPADGEIEFAAGEGNARIRAAFELKKMRVRGAIDF